jgi:multidrug efflux pump subunit AcrA (membrane-fusion protein)
MLKRGLTIFAGIVLVLAILSIIRMRPVRAKLNPPVEPPTSSYTNAVGGIGLVEAQSENIQISVPVAGLVTRVDVRAGDRVRKGDRLFVLDGRELEAELALRRSSVEVAKARLQKLLNSPRPEEVPPAEAKMREAEEVVKDAQVQLDLIERVKDPRAIRQEDLLRRRLSVTAAQARFEQTKADLTLLKAGAWKPDVDVARKEVAEAQRQAGRVEADLDRLTVTAPISGEILQCKVHPGEYAQAGPLAQPLILMGDTSRLNVRADVDEEDAWRVQTGATATGAPRGGSGIRLPLRFVRVEPYIIPKKSLTGDSTERVDTRVMQVLFAIAPGTNIQPGQQLDVFIDGKQVRP